MAEAKPGDTARIRQEGRIEDSIVFDSSQGREAIESVVRRDRRIEKSVLLDRNAPLAGKVRVSELEPLSATAEERRTEGRKEHE